MVSRVERGPVADWMRTADRSLIGSFVTLMVIGLVMALAASPAVAERLNLTTFHFVDRQALMLVPTAALMIATSFLTPRQMRRAALDLRPPAVRVHQAGVRGSRRLGLHRGRAERPDGDSGQNPVLHSAAGDDRTPYPRA